MKVIVCRWVKCAENVDDGRDEKSIHFSFTNLEIRYNIGNVKMDHSEIGQNISSGSGYRSMTTSINTALRLHVA
jgi:hypothetical protein